ncbi:hypothetical protein BDV38DRAFT_289425 [Aspergillus pseudotamarii]|uniref:Uncharacterized protein n=1 Tax=Aspergillus pseudotamarii TaxID=132259 RepID=A0A5N6S7W9_ASPPS|nr:uncharacterized protein BDV38DRAFT_289425 [Aspergillus pseudotamarii]KAE8130665.1 hypothetical protein BDV38DRAFT_289425 [Aspergillus pseudotamarii]
MSETYQIVGANVDLTSPSEGGTEWTVEQKTPELEIEYPEPHVRIGWAYGPINLVDGYVDPNTLEIVVAPVIAQVYLGTIEGNLKDGLSVRFNLSSSEGRLDFYLKNGNEVWLKFDLRIRFGGYYVDEMRLLSI